VRMIRPRRFLRYEIFFLPLVFLQPGLPVSRRPAFVFFFRFRFDETLLKQGPRRIIFTELSSRPPSFGLFPFPVDSLWADAVRCLPNVLRQEHLTIPIRTHRVRSTIIRRGFRVFGARPTLLSPISPRHCFLAVIRLP